MPRSLLRGALFDFTVPKYTTYTSYQAYVTPPTSQYEVNTMPYSQYQSNYATYSGSSSLWVQGSSGLAQFVVVPQGASLSLTAISPTGGSGYLYEIAPGGVLSMNNYNFYQYNQMSYYANAVGQHVLLFIIGDTVSNAIIIDVTSSGQPGYSQPSSQPPGYQAPGYQAPSSQQSGYQPPSGSQPPGYSQPSSGYTSPGGY